MERRTLIAGSLLLFCSTLLSSAETRYVNANSSSPMSPYTSWITAAKRIQEAVDVATAGDEVIVTNGIYATGTRGVLPGLLCRVAVDKPVVVKSVNGPGATVIEGYKDPSGYGSIRCVYLTNKASLSGFTVRNGATTWYGSVEVEPNGGGIYCASSDAVVSNCVLSGNWASDRGGGACRGTLLDCVLSNNYAFYGGGIFSGLITNCTLQGNEAKGGGGAYASTLHDCRVISNTTGNDANGSGGGAYSSVLIECHLIRNTAWRGGAASFSTLYNCSLISNSAIASVTLGSGGAASSCTLIACLLQGNVAKNGGGAYFGDLMNCLVVSNTAQFGGGVDGSSLVNCLVSGNYAYSQGGGAYDPSATNCTLVGNRAGQWGGGASGGTLHNCIIYFNAAPQAANHNSYSPLYYCCTTPLAASGYGSITNEPLLTVDFRLRPNSPCINAGNNAWVAISNDYAGLPRVVGGTVDIGAYEFQDPKSIISYAWLQEFGLTLDGSGDHEDNDNDGVSNWLEWLGGTDPTDTSSVLRIQALTVNGPRATLSWIGDSSRAYIVERARGLGGQPGFVPLATNGPGWGGLWTYTDTNAMGAGAALYRLVARP